MRPFDLVLFSLAASAAPIDGASPEFTCNGDICYLPPPKAVEPTYFENGQQVPDFSHFSPPPTTTKSEEAPAPTDQAASGGSGSSGSAVGSVIGGAVGAGTALGGLLGAAGSAANGALGAAGAAGGATGGAGSPEAAGNAGAAGETVSTGATAAGAGAAEGPTVNYEGDVSELPPPKKPTETYFDKDLNEIPGPNGDERTFELNVSGEGEGALNEGGNTGRGGAGPSRAGPSQSRGINLGEFRDSDKSIARMYLNSKDSPHVKSFDGGRTADEKQLFSSVRDRYSNLKEVKATSDKESNYAARNRGRYRYIAGTNKEGKEVLVGVAEHGTNNNNFVNFTPFPKPQ